MPGFPESIRPHEVHSVDMALCFFCPASPRNLQRRRGTLLSAQTQYEGVLKQSGLEIVFKIKKWTRNPKVLSGYTLTANYVFYGGSFR